jgi:CheY-like chemotaxis protein
MRILVVDDESMIREIIVSILNDQYNCEVVEAENGLSGLEQCQSANFDLIISDHRMPKKTGVQMILDLRAGSSVNQHVPVIVVTGYVEEVEAILKTDSCYLLAKPFKEDQLIKLINLSCPVLGKNFKKAV